MRKEIKLALGSAALYFVCVHFCVGVWVHYYYAGEYAGPLMISTLFGVSEPAMSIGVRPIYERPITGWDGQFYYTQSNDPFLQVDYSQNTLFDIASYRFQRNGLPLLAWLVRGIFGQEVTSPYLFMMTQLAIMSVAFGTLVAYLHNRRVHSSWALIWAAYGGVVRPFLHGLPDPTADAFCLFSILALLHRRIWLYAIFASVLCLCRESYAAPAGFVWLLTLFGKIPWGSVQVPGGWAGFIRRGIVTAIPGIVVLAWSAFVAVQTQSKILAGSRSIPWGGLVDLPFKAFFQCLWHDISVGEEQEAIYSLSCAMCIALVLWHIVSIARKHWFAVAAIPHIVLMSMTGWIVWEAGVGFFKNTGSIVLLGVMALPLTASKSLRTTLLFTFLCGLHYVYRVDYRHQQFLPPLEVVATVTAPPVEVQPTPPGFTVSSEIELLSLPPARMNNVGWWNWVHRYPQKVHFRIRNTSDIPWPASQCGKDVIAVGTKFLDQENVLQETRLPLYKEVGPGEMIEFSTVVPLPAGTLIGTSAPRYSLLIGVVHDANYWFFDRDETQKLLVPL